MRNCKNTSHLTAKIPFLQSKNTPPSSITCTLSFSQFVCIPAHNKRFIPVCKQEALISAHKLEARIPARKPDAQPIKNRKHTTFTMKKMQERTVQQ
jgi:hypothetical protein